MIGKLSEKVLNALLETLPLEFSVLSAEDKVLKIINEMKAGQRDQARFWIDLQGKKVLIEYYALRDASGQYLGCLEASQDITELQKLTGEQRLLT